jgi:hypothetical protein
MRFLNFKNKMALCFQRLSAAEMNLKSKPAFGG